MCRRPNELFFVEPIHRSGCESSEHATALHVCVGRWIAAVQSEHRFEVGDRQQPSYHWGRVADHEIPACIRHALGQLEEYMQPARIDKGHSGEIEFDRATGPIRGFRERGGQRSTGCRVDLASHQPAMRRFGDYHTGRVDLHNT